jgi:hypothetical protein
LNEENAMNRPTLSTLRRERGAVLIHVAVAMVGLLGFSALVLDYGVMWTARRQAQNAADAAALAGAIAMNQAPGDYDRAREAAKHIGETNFIFGQAPNITLGSGDSTDETEDISFPLCPPGSPGEGQKACIRVNVYRNADKDPLPTFFARLLGLVTQGVKATATAEIIAANESSCIKPWAIPDRWDESSPGADPVCSAPGGIQYPYFETPAGNNGCEDYDYDFGINKTYTPSVNGGLDGNDLYVPASDTESGTGYAIKNPETGEVCCDYGRPVNLKLSDKDQWAAFWSQEIIVPDCNSPGSKCYEDAITGCSIKGFVGEEITVKPGVSDGPTGPHGVEELVAQDPDAFWYNPPTSPTYTRYPSDPTTVTIPSDLAGKCPNGCIYSPLTGINASPRIGAIPTYDPNDMGLLGGGTFTITMTNILGFFVSGTSGHGSGVDPQVVTGRLITVPGDYNPNGGPVSQSFLTKIILVR